MANAVSRLAWNNSVANMVDMAVAWFIDFAMASKSLDRAGTDIDSCCRHRYAAEENKSACELIEINLRALALGYSEEFEVKVGVHQGPVLSSLLFILCLKPYHVSSALGSPGSISMPMTLPSSLNRLRNMSGGS